MRIELGLPSWVALVQGDNIIPYNLDSSWMVDDLVRNLMRVSSALLTDVFPDDMRPDIRRDGLPHFHELQVALRFNGDSASQHRRSPICFSEAVAPIWDEWAYLKLYTPFHLQNAVLLKLAPLLDRLVAEDVAEGYFFVRYQDEGGSHLRIRINRPAGDALATVLPKLKETLAGLDSDRLVHSTVIQPYVREVARYGGAGTIDVCERIFCADSRYIMECISLELPEDAGAWRLAAAAIDTMLTSFGYVSMDEKLDFARRAARDFDAEMGFDSDQRGRIGDLYRKSRPLFDSGQLAADIRGCSVFLGAIPELESLWRDVEASLRASSEDAEASLYSIQWSLIHMRLNRLLLRDARIQEAVVWELLKRSYAREVLGRQRLKEA